MYVNFITLDNRKTLWFVTEEEIFTPFSPMFKAIQDALVEEGWKMVDNHNFELKLSKIAFRQITPDEANYWYPDPIAMSQRYADRNIGATLIDILLNKKYTFMAKDAVALIKSF